MAMVNVQRLVGSVGISVFALLAACGGDSGEQAGSPDPTSIEGIETFVIGEAEHVETVVDYPQSPPVGGNHNSIWVNCGFYPGEVPNENAVHALEHGAVWITYAPGTESAVLDELQTKAGEDSHILVSEFVEQESPLVLSAWGAQVSVDAVDDERVDQFISSYLRSSASPEPGATCAGGVGEPT